MLHYVGSFILTHIHFFGQLVLGFVIAVISSALTLILGLKRFRSEKWWEKKFEAYSTILESLHHIREYADTWTGFAERDQSLKPEDEKELKNNVGPALAKLRKHIDIGTFIISKKADSTLRDFMKKLDTNQTTAIHDLNVIVKAETYKEGDEDERFEEYLKSFKTIADECLRLIRPIGKKDLRLKGIFNIFSL
jgi:hypothetical protein